MSKLYAAHQKDNKTFGVDLESDGPNIKDMCTNDGVYDLYSSRYWGIKLASNAACTILRVDQVREVVCVRKLFKCL